MGIFKDSLKEEESRKILTQLGFKYKRGGGAQGETGYVKTIPHDKNEVLWITINLQEKKYIYIMNGNVEGNYGKEHMIFLFL